MAAYRDFPPRLMQAVAAAHYLGISPTKFRTLGIPFKRSGANCLWDRLDLDRYADGLPYDPTKEEEEMKCGAADRAWGTARAS